MRLTRVVSVVALAAAAILAAACGSDDDSLVIYSGRTSSLVQPVLEQFAEDTGIGISVRYGSSAGTAALVLEEGDNSPADLVLLQDAGALGALAKEGVLVKLDDALLDRVDAQFRSPKGDWVGISGRARAIVYNTDSIRPEELPASILDYTAPEWRGRVGWAPTNGSFQAFVTALRVLHGDEAAKNWLIGIKENDPSVYPNNITTVAATAAGEVDVGFVNHYYLHRFLAEHGEGFKARNHYSSGDAGALINVAGVGVLKRTDASDRFVDYLLSESAQEYFAQRTAEYPLIEGVQPLGEVPPLETLNPPAIDLSNLDDLRGTIDLLREAGVL